MALDRPTREDLRSAARAHHLTLSEAEEKAYTTLFDVFLSDFDTLDAMPDPFAASMPPGREFWTPLKDENPYNAIVRRCSVKGSLSGPLKGKRIGLKDNIAVAGVEMTLGST